MQNNQTSSTQQENYIIELFKTILPYKWSILFITIFTIILTKYYLYFIPPTYESSAIIKVKINKNPMETRDFLRDSINTTSTVGIKQEMLSLQTFRTNKVVLEEINFSIQYFQKDKYKMLELYKNSPIDIKLSEEVNFKFLKKKITFIPKEDGFTLMTEDFGESEVYPYDKEIITKYFKGKVNKLAPFSQKLYLLFNGDLRNIYQKIISKSLKITQIDLEANLIKVSFQDTIPQRADVYVNALIKAYMSQSINQKDSTNNKVISFLDIQLAAIKQKLEKSENELENYKTLNRVEPNIRSQDSFEKLSTIDLELSELTLKDKLATNLITFIKNNRNLDAIGPTLLEFNDQATIKFIDTLEQLQQQEDELKIEFTDQYPQLKSIKKRIKRIKSKILLNVQNLQSTLVSKRNNLEKQKNKYELILQELPKKEKKLISFQRDYEVNSKMYTYLLEKKSENELIKVASVSDYEIIDQAYTPSIPVKPKRLILLIVAAIIGFIVAVFIALLRALLMDKVATSKEIKLMTKLPVYGLIPLYDNAMFSTLKLKEAYHKLATNLQFSKEENTGSIILLTSHSQGEGKTTTVVSLAGVFQNCGYKTIVIDLNMKIPSLHAHFGIEQQYAGISTYLSQRDNIGNIIFSTNFENLDIITAGPVPPNPSELILSKRLPELFLFLKEKYDYIILDTSSYNDALETQYLMQFTNMNLIVFREKMSKKSSIIQLEKLIQEKNLQNIGLVLKSVIKEDKDNDLLINSPIPNKLETSNFSPIQVAL